MAIILPSTAFSNAFSVAEQRLLEVIQLQLSDAYTVLHSLDWHKAGHKLLRHGECDFVILHRSLGLMVIEAKPGDLSHGVDGWTAGNQQPTKDPVAQAKRGLHAIHDFLCQNVVGWEAANVPHTFAIYLSGASGFRGQVPLGMDHSQLIFESQLNDLTHTLQQIRQRTNPASGSVPQELLKQAVTCLMPEFSLKPSICGALRHEHLRIEQFTEHQKSIMDMMADHPRIAVKGCAGSGKTVLAIERARLLSSAGQRVLLLCYNLKLCALLRQRIQDLALSRVDVYAFHSLAEHLAGLMNVPLQCPSDPAERSRYYDEQCPQALEEAIRRGAAGCYDAIVVDEGQDFCEAWWVLIEDLLQDPQAGSLAVFYDPHQNIFQREMGFPISGPPFVLNRNCRNTKQITKFIGQTVDRNQLSMEGMPDGEAVTVKYVRSREETVSAVHRLVQKLIHEERLQPAQLMIVGPRRFSNSPFANEARLGNIPLVDEQQWDGSGGAIQYTTVYRFKGLEADVVILTGFCLPLPLKDQCLFYTAATRGRLRLFLFCEVPEGSPYVTATAIE